MDDDAFRKVIQEARRAQQTDLNMTYRDIRSIPSEIGALTQLKLLWLGDNQITSLPAEIGALHELEELVLRRNAITSLPPQIGELRNLQVLMLQGNKIKMLPPEIGKLKKLQELWVAHNPLESPFKEIAALGQKDLIAFMHDLAKGISFRYEAKLLVLGDGGVGKTCVSRALRDLAFEDQETTHGVEIDPWVFQHPDNSADEQKPITLNIWDFEGQEINHQTHQFFLTRGSLYLIVFNGREIFHLDRMEYWLDTIRSRAPESEVILVATHCEERCPYVPLDELRTRYADLLKQENCYFPLGCDGGVGVNALKQHLMERATVLDVMGTSWPESYTAIEKEIEQFPSDRAHVTRCEIESIFARNGVPESNFDMVLRLFGDLGILTHFSECHDLRDFIVLKPHWLTKAISHVLEDPQLSDDRGEITHERMHQLWEDRYPGLSDTFHRCMRDFELCYDLEHLREHLSLIPLRFSFIRPKEIPWSNIPAYKERRVEYRFAANPPFGMMSRLIVKVHHMIVKTPEMPKGVFWHNGVFVRTGESGSEWCSEGLCEFDREKRVLRFTVRAAFPQNLIEQLNAFAWAVFDFFEGLAPQRFYGCVKHADAAETPCTGLHSEQRIASSLAKGRLLDCEYEGHDIEPLYLVTGISSFGHRQSLPEEIRRIFREEMDKQPEWARRLGRSIDVVLAKVDTVVPCVEDIRTRTQRLPATIEQQVQLIKRDLLWLFSEMLDNRDFSSAPAIISIVPAETCSFDPRTWFKLPYILTPYCEHEGGIHACDYCVEFTFQRKWWTQTAPKLAYAFKIFAAALRIGFASLPLLLDDPTYQRIKDEAHFMYSLAGELDKAVQRKRSKEMAAQGRQGIVSDLHSTPREARHIGNVDEQRMIRSQIAALLREIAPENYDSREWGSLRRVKMPDNTYRWLCETHAREVTR